MIKNYPQVYNYFKIQKIGMFIGNLWICFTSGTFEEAFKIN